jgi:iron complex outermembrane receptor protein
VLLDAGGGQWAIHADAFGRTASDYRVPSYPYLTPPDPADLPNATQPGAFNGRQPNSSMRTNGQSFGASHFFAGGFNGIAVAQTNSLYRIPGAEPENANGRIDAEQTRLTGKGEYRPDASAVDAVRYWWGATDYRHNELALADATDPATDGVRQTFTNREQEGRIETTFTPIALPFAEMSTAVGAQAGHQKLTADSPDNSGLWDPNSNSRVAGYVFNEFRFTPTTRAQLAGRIEHVDLNGFARTFPLAGGLVSTPVSPSFTPKSGSVGLLHDLPWNLVASITGQYVERAPKPAELFSGGPHEATGTFDKGNANLGIEKASSVEIGLRRAAGPFRFEATAYATRFTGFIYRRLTGDTCDEDTGACGPGAGELSEALYTQRNATFRGAEFQSQLDVAPLAAGMFGIENQFDVVRATFEDGSNVPRIPPLRIGGGVFWRDASWLVRVNVLHAFAQRNIAMAGETPTSGYNDLRAEISYRTKITSPTFGLSELSVGLLGTNLLNEDIRNHVSYNKDEVLMPGAGVRAFATVKF